MKTLPQLLPFVIFMLMYFQAESATNRTITEKPLGFKNPVSHRRVRYFKPVFKKSIAGNSTIKVYSLTNASTTPPTTTAMTTLASTTTTTKKSTTLTTPVRASKQHKRMNELSRFALVGRTTTASPQPNARRRDEVIDALTNINFLIGKLEKELGVIDRLYAKGKYARKVLTAVNKHLKPAYESMRAQLCNMLDFDEQEDDDEDKDDTDNDMEMNDDSHIYFKKPEMLSNSNLIEAMYKKDLKRRTARFSKSRRVSRRICF
jgi:hypothetical protein